MKCSAGLRWLSPAAPAISFVTRLAASHTCPKSSRPRVGGDDIIVGLNRDGIKFQFTPPRGDDRDSAMNIPVGSPTKAPQTQSSHLSYFCFTQSLLGKFGYLCFKSSISTKTGNRRVRIIHMVSPPYFSSHSVVSIYSNNDLCWFLLCILPKHNIDHPASGQIQYLIVSSDCRHPP